MSNASGTTARREEEIAFLAVESALGIDIVLADTDGRQGMPDGNWDYPDGSCRRAVIEVTSPPADLLMKQWAQQRRDGVPQTDEGDVPTRLGETDLVVSEMLNADWGRQNVDKLLRQPADERHLFLFGRGHDVAKYFYRLADPGMHGGTEEIGPIVLPDGITDIWFRGRTTLAALDVLGPKDVRIARFQASSGWTRYVVRIDEQDLPSFDPRIAKDRAPEGWRTPKVRTADAVRARACGSDAPSSES